VDGPAREPGPLRLVVTLTTAGLLSGLVLVGAYLLTAPRIARNRAEALRAAIYRVLPATDSITALERAEDSVVPAEEGATGELVYACRGPDGELVGYAVPAAGPGFMDTVKVIYGLEPRRRVIVGLQVLESRETPGLGDKIAYDPQFLANFQALSVEPAIEPVKRGEKTADNQVDCITGATISSEAVVDILNRSAGRWLPLLAERPVEGGGVGQ
jgi:electron transport complex protein RnfG